MSRSIFRKPSLKRSIKARTTGRIKREIKKAIIPGYGKKGMGVIKNPKRSFYNAVYHRTSIDTLKPLKKKYPASSGVEKQSSNANNSNCEKAYKPNKNNLKNQLVTLKSKNTGVIKQVSSSQSWTTLFFGLLVPFFRNDIKYFLIFSFWEFLGIFTLGISTIVILIKGCLHYNQWYINELIKDGYYPVDDKSEKALSSIGISILINTPKVNNTSKNKIKKSKSNNNINSYQKYKTSYDSPNNDSFVKTVKDLNKIKKSNPKMEDYFDGRSYAFPKYDDSYDTGYEFKLREILLLVWWAQTKNGRSTSAHIPKYFFNTYNLNVDYTTQQFESKGWLMPNNGRMMVSSDAKTVYEKFSNLWKLHLIDQFPINLDLDFPNWEDHELLKIFYQDEIDFLKAKINYSNEMADFFKKHFELFNNKENWKNTIDSYINSSNNIQKCVYKDEAKISAM